MKSLHFDKKSEVRFTHGERGRQYKHVADKLIGLIKLGLLLLT